MRIQSLLLPFDKRYRDCPGLFYVSGETSIAEPGRLVKDDLPLTYVEVDVSQEGLDLDVEDRVLTVREGKTASFCTYFNSCSIKKWFELTCLDAITLHVRAKGRFEVVLKAFSCDDVELKDQRVFGAQHEELGRYRFESDGLNETIVDVPPCDATVVGFDLVALSSCEIYEGWVEGHAEAGERNPVELGLITTTFKKEEFITANIAMLEEEVFASDDELGNHFHVFVVDNGRTLDPSEFENDHVKVFPNLNAGGAGGFARGMIESLRSDVPFTHVLIMDDDVVIQSESIKRMYALLTVLKPAYQGRYISGAMLLAEQMNVQHEDIGFVHRGGFFSSKKGMRNMLDPRAFVTNEAHWPDFGDEYAAWWFCCIPMRYVTESTLPLPVFVRGDDVEYSLRNHPGFITLNGISVWHVGFSQKYSASMELYQVTRNSLIVQAASGACPNARFFETIRELFDVQLYQYAYDYADLLIDAIEDFLKGPAFLESSDGAQIMAEKAASNECLRPLAEFKDIDVGLDFDDTESLKAVYQDEPVGFFDRIKRFRTKNGNRNASDSYFKKAVGTTPYDWSFTVGKQTGVRSILAINPYQKTGVLRPCDPKRFETVMARGERVFADYHARHESVERAWRERYPYLTSRAFWDKYLEIASPEDRSN